MLGGQTPKQTGERKLSALCRFARYDARRSSSSWVQHESFFGLESASALDCAQFWPFRRWAHARTRKLETVNYSRLGISVTSLLLGLAAARPAAADTVVDNDKVGEYEQFGKDANEVAGAIANFYGAGQAYAAAIQWLTTHFNPSSPTAPQVTNNQIYNAILDMDSNVNAWSIIQARNAVAGALETGLEYTGDCTRPADCDVRTNSRISTEDEIVKNGMNSLTKKEKETLKEYSQTIR